MTEDEARAFTLARISQNVPRGTYAPATALERFHDHLLTCSAAQNLVSKATKSAIWSRHIADSAQLLDLLDTSSTPSAHALHTVCTPGRWLDLGSGAGFPGLVIAALTGFHVTLVESRRMRIDFLRESATLMGIAERVTVAGQRLETLAPFAADVISARAFAPLDRLLTLAHSFSTAQTLWLLPKGRSVRAELDQALRTWQGAFRIVPSATDAEAGIIVAQGVQPRHHARAGAPSPPPGRTRGGRPGMRR